MLENVKASLLRVDVAYSTTGCSPFATTLRPWASVSRDSGFEDPLVCYGVSLIESWNKVDVYTMSLRSPLNGISCRHRDDAIVCVLNQNMSVRSKASFIRNLAA